MVNLKHLGRGNYFYLPTKLWECNVFSHVCPRGGGYVIISNDTLDLTEQGPPLPVQMCSTWDHAMQGHVRHVQTCLLQSMYSWQAGSWNPTGMFSWFEIFLN